MPGMHGLNGLINLRNEAPTIPVVIVSAEQDKQIVLQAITYGAVGFITKSSPRQQMTEAISRFSTAMSTCRRTSSAPRKAAPTGA
jgi:DNA-binding NarL/FixJ family response regulator